MFNLKIKAMKRNIIFAVIMLAALFAAGQNQELKEIDVKAPLFHSALYDNINDFLLSGIEYPTEAINAGYEGTEVIRFTVTPDGKVTDIKVINSVCDLIDKEVIRILSITNGMWIPRNEKGEPVVMVKEISLKFQINPASDFVAMAKRYLTKANQMFFIDKQPKKAIKYLDKGINLLPYDETLLVVRGMCQYELGDENGAQEDWSRIADNGKIDLNEYTAQLEETKGYNAFKALIQK
jgi:TonB family protein